MEQQGWYDYVVVNDQVSDCVNEILNIIAKEAD
jgi:guanylate kinase